MLMIRTRAEAPGALSLGRCGENLARRIEFDFAAWGPGAPVLEARRPGAEEYYTPGYRIDPERGYLVWDITETDTQTAGTGRLRLTLLRDGAVARQIIRETVVDESMT